MAAYGLKYLCEYRSKMRGRLLYRIEIEERGAVAETDATVHRMRPYSDVFTIKWGGTDDAEYTAVKGSTVTLKVLCVDDMAYLDLFTTDPRQFRMTIYEYRDDAQGNPEKRFLWRGFLSANSYKESFARPPYVVTISATDGLSILNAIPFRNALGAKYTGVHSLYYLYTQLFELLGLDMPCIEWTGLIDDQSAEAAPSFFSICIDTARIYRTKPEATWRDILEICSQTFNAQVFQAGGQFHIRRIMSLRDYRRPWLLDDGTPPGGGTPEPLIREFWKGGCDMNSSTELNLLAPYKSAEVSVDVDDIDENELYYLADNWLTFNASRRFFKDRALFRTILGGLLPGEQLFPGGWARLDMSNVIPGRSATVSLSETIYNGSTYDIWVRVAPFCKSGATVRFWNLEQKKWVSSSDDLPKTKISKSEESATDYYPYKNLENQKFDFEITNIPDIVSTQDGTVTLGLASFFDRTDETIAAGRTIRLFIAEIEMEGREGEATSDMKGLTLEIGSGSADCKWSIPTRDGGHVADAKTIIPTVLINADETPIERWVAPVERGTLMGILTDDIRRLRSNIARQLYGELRCPEGVDMNTLFADYKFTKAVYYINSLELLASRQIYKVQLRELLDTTRYVEPFKWHVAESFANKPHIKASLNDVLVLLVGPEDGVSQVWLYDTVIGKPAILGYRGEQIDIRKGYGSVAVQIVDTNELYAIDNVGGVLSTVASEYSDALNFATAIYDADRGVWVSFDTEKTPGKTTVTVFSKDMELLTLEEFEAVATRLLLMANGYVLVDDLTDSTWWHSYELHASDTLLAVNDPSDPVSNDQWPALNISDTLLLKLVGEDRILDIGYRYGLKLHATSVSYGLYDGSGVIDDVVCNNQIAAWTVRRTMSAAVREVWCVDTKSRKNYHISLPVVYGVAVCGEKVYALGLSNDGLRRELYCLSFEENCLTKSVNKYE